MRVQVAAEIVELDQRRNLSVARRLQLAGVLPQLRWDERVAEPFVHLDLVPRPEDLAGLHVLDPVLRDGEAAPDGVLAEGDVVPLRAGEVLEEIAERLRRNHAEVETQTVVRDD